MTITTKLATYRSVFLNSFGKKSIFIHICRNLNFRFIQIISIVLYYNHFFKTKYGRSVRYEENYRRTIPIWRCQFWGTFGRPSCSCSCTVRRRFQKASTLCCLSRTKRIYPAPAYMHFFHDLSDFNGCCLVLHHSWLWLAFFISSNWILLGVTEMRFRCRTCLKSPKLSHS